jgi:phosphoribosylformylglycinamidine synthase
MNVIVNIYLKSGVLDSQGKAVHHALDSLNFEGVEDVRIGRQVVLRLSTTDEKEAIKEATDMANRLLANTIIEDFKVEILR